MEKIEELAHLGKQEDILILPGIELRSELGGSQTIHFTGIFPIENIDATWDKIKGKLELTEYDIETVGDERVYKDLADSCEIFHDLGGITTIHAGTKSNSIENIKNYFLHKRQQKEDLLKNSIDILEIGKEENIDDYEKIVFPQIGFKAPLVIGSDNHKIKDYNLKQNCWIKADLTFEGLKQIIYEPEERVKIQEACPDKKNDYAVIESIKFEDGDFTDSEIGLNSNLVSIIGGRSTGKSIFLRSIARAIDKNYVENVCNNVSRLINPETIVKWKNGKEETSEDDSKNKIIYIPQNFLNDQITEAEPDSFSYKLISDILKSDEDYTETFSNIETHIHNFETETYAKITRLFETEDKLNDLEKQLKELGNPEDVKDQIKKLDDQYDRLQSEDVSDDDKKLQEVLVEQLSDVKKKISSLKSDESILSKSLDYLTPKKTFFDRDIIEDLSELTRKDINSEITEADVIYKDSLITIVTDKVDALKKDVGELQKEIISKEEELETLNKKLNSSRLAEDVFEKMEEERKILSLIMEKEEEIKKIEKTNEYILKDIFDGYGSFIENLEHEQNRFSFSEEYDNFEAEVSFKTKEFRNSLGNSLNKRKFPTFKNKYNIDLYEFEYNRDDFLKDLENIINAILNGILTTKSGKNKKTVIKELLGVYHFINFNIVEDGEKLEEMSPGKKSFALLKVLIESDKSKWPILLDQPEDDLDANSISKSLSTFLREKKRIRQIIIVSHNPNLVVGADSEQIIIANQEGSDSKNKSKKFEYISGSIENTYSNEDDCYLYCRGIKEHICEILEGGEESFKKRQKKYNID